MTVPLGVASGGRPTRVGRRRRRLTFDRVSFMVVFLIVPVAIFLIFVIYPFVLAFYYSLTDWSGFSSDIPFIGIGNYVKLFQDDLFQHALINNILLAVVVPAVTIFLALVFASLITVAGPSHGNIRGIRASSLYRTLSFFPYCVPAIAIGIIWLFVYDPSAGLLNGVLGVFGDHDQTPWLGQVSTAMPASMFVIVWSFVGFYTVLFVAAIKGVPAETYEAVRLDGAGRWRTAVSVTVPLIRDNVQTAYIYIGIAALDAFVYMTALFPNAGGPANTTLVMSQLLFNEAFRKGHFGYATAMGVVLAIVTLIFAAIVFGVNRLLAGSDRGDRR